MNSKFDIFLSYKSEEAKWVEQLKQSLQNRGVRVWLDNDQIRPGDIFVQALEDGLDTSKAVGLVITPESLASNWVKEEYYRATSLAIAGKLQLIPLLLRNTNLPGFLSGRNGVDFRDSEMYDKSIDKLVWPGITGKRVVFVGIGSIFSAPWDDLIGLINEKGMEYIEGQDIHRVTFDIDRLMQSHRVVVVIDMFEGYPYTNWQRNTPSEYIDFIFQLRESTRNTSSEVVFLLYHHSSASLSLYKNINSAFIKRLDHYHFINRDINKEDLQKQFNKNWLKIQRDFMKSEYES